MIALIIAFSAQVSPLTNYHYRMAIDTLLSNAQKEILVVMYSASDDDVKKSLIQAQQRGVDVEVILDVSCWNQENSEKNHEFGKILRDNGIKVFYDNPFRTTHDKLIIIDRKITIIGSHNWTYSALHLNNEASVVIVSKRIAIFFYRYFKKIKKEAYHEQGRANSSHK